MCGRWGRFAVPHLQLMRSQCLIRGGPTLQGAAQFGRDVAAVAALLAPYTRRPLAYFRELADAATLLALPADHVSIMTACAWSMAGAGL